MPYYWYGFILFSPVVTLTEWQITDRSLDTIAITFATRNSPIKYFKSWTLIIDQNAQNVDTMILWSILGTRRIAQQSCLRSNLHRQCLQSLGNGATPSLGHPNPPLSRLPPPVKVANRWPGSHRWGFVAEWHPAWHVHTRTPGEKQKVLILKVW